MRTVKALTLVVALALLAATATTVLAHGFGRQYYGGWTYYPERTYYYRYYYYQPYDGADYNYHYCIYYPTQPQYVYYYNPYSGYYWGRLDLKATGDKKYSLLAEKDRKANLKDIDEKAFPAPDVMPPIPESKDKVAMKPIDPTDLPKTK
jgi:hypothetical protein